MKNSVLHYNSVVNWDSGSPVVEFKQMLTKEVMSELPLIAISLMYERTEEEIMLGVDPEFEGKTNAEVMNIRLARSAARGNKDSIKMLTDRILGKPKQQIETHKVTENYHEFVDRITEEENKLLEAKANVL